MGGNTRDGSTPFSRTRKAPASRGFFSLCRRQDPWQELRSCASQAPLGQFRNELRQDEPDRHRYPNLAPVAQIARGRLALRDPNPLDPRQECPRTEGRSRLLTNGGLLAQRQSQCRGRHQSGSMGNVPSAGRMPIKADTIDPFSSPPRPTTINAYASAITSATSVRRSPR